MNVENPKPGTVSSLHEESESRSPAKKSSGKPPFEPLKPGLERKVNLVVLVWLSLLTFVVFVLLVPAVIPASFQTSVTRLCAGLTAVLFPLGVAWFCWSKIVESSSTIGSRPNVEVRRNRHGSGNWSVTIRAPLALGLIGLTAAGYGLHAASQLPALLSPKPASPAGASTDGKKDTPQEAETQPVANHVVLRVGSQQPSDGTSQARPADNAPAPAANNGAGAFPTSEKDGTSVEDPVSTPSGSRPETDSGPTGSPNLEPELDSPQTNPRQLGDQQPGANP